MTHRCLPFWFSASRRSTRSSMRLSGFTCPPDIHHVHLDCARDLECSRTCPRQGLEFPGCEDGAASDRELGPTGLLPALEAPRGERPRAYTATPWTVRFTTCFRPARLLEAVVSLLLAHAQYTRQRQCPSGLCKSEMPRHSSALPPDDEAADGMWDNPAAC